MYMKPEKEWKWVVLLYNSPFTKKMIGGSPGSRKDFRDLLKVSEKDATFEDFFKELLAEGSIRFDGKEKNKTQKNVDVFFIDKEMMFRRLKNNALYNPSKKIIIEKDTLLAI